VEAEATEAVGTEAEDGMEADIGTEAVGMEGDSTVVVLVVVVLVGVVVVGAVGVGAVGDPAGVGVVTTRTTRIRTIRTVAGAVISPKGPRIT
jgi:hypothetical protein